MQIVAGFDNYCSLTYLFLNTQKNFILSQETKMDNIFREEEFSLSPEEFPECQDVNRNESNFGNLEDNTVSNAQDISGAGTSSKCRLNH